MRRARIVGWICAAVGPAILIITCLEQLGTSGIASRGIKVQGTILDRTALDGGQGRTGYQVTVDYKPLEGQGGRIFRKKFLVSRTEFETLTIGSRVPVRYLASDPGRSILEGERRRSYEKLVIAAASTIFGIAVLLVLRKKRTSTSP